MKFVLLLFLAVKSQYVQSKDADGRLEIVTQPGVQLAFSDSTEIANGLVLYPEWSFSVEFFVESHHGHSPKLLHMYNQDENNERIECQSRIPFILFSHNTKNDNKRFVVSFNVNKEESSDGSTWDLWEYKTNQWQTVSMSQYFDGSEFIFEVSFNDGEPKTYINNSPRVYSNVKAIQHKDGKTLNGWLKNFNFTTFDSGRATVPDCNITDLELECTTNQMKLVFNNCLRVSDLYLSSYTDPSNKTSITEFSLTEKHEGKCGKVKVLLDKSHYRSL